MDKEYFKQIKPKDIYVSCLTHRLVRNAEGWTRMEKISRTASPTGCHFMDAVASLLADGICSPGGLADYLGVDVGDLKSTFRVLTGMRTNEFLLEYRMMKVKELLSYTNVSLSEIARRTGFRSQATLSPSFFRLFKEWPTDYRRHHRPKNYDQLYRW